MCLVLLPCGCSIETDRTDLWKVSYQQAVKHPCYQKILQITRNVGVPTSATEISFHTYGFQDVDKFLVFKAEKADIEKFGDSIEPNPLLQMKFQQWPTKPKGYLHTLMSGTANKMNTRFWNLIRGADQIKNGKYYEDGRGLFIAVDIDKNIVYLMHL